LQWFDKRQGFALGIVVSGSPLGGICWPPILNSLLHAVGFAWTVRVTGFICLGLLAPSCWLIVGRKTQPSGSQNGLSTLKLDLAVILQDSKYTIFSAGMFLVLWGTFIPFFYLPTYGYYSNLDEDTANILVSFLNAGSLISRIAIGYAADKLGR
jgi:MFS family permease